VFERSARDPGSLSRDSSSSVRLKELAAEAVTTAEAGSETRARSSAGRLAERWLPAGSPGSPRRRRLAVSAALLGVVAVVLTTVILAGGKPGHESPPPLPPAGKVAAAPVEASLPTATKLVVSVVGKVSSPGLVTVPAGSRVADALAAAGGAVPGTDLHGLNLARRLADGEQLAVGVPVSAAEPAQPGSGAPAAKLDLNTAGLEQLDTLPGVGEVTAKRIVEWRTRHGRFSTIEQLRDIDGIGPSKYSKLRDQVSVQ
jgi:competence protein ComEA